MPGEKSSELNVPEVKSTEVSYTPGEYELIFPRDEKNTKIVFNVFGCAGNGKPEQKEVATLMEDVTKKAPDDLKPKFCIGLGDNIYDNGVLSPTDPLFQTYFYNMYQQPSFTATLKMPYIMIRGNHCHNFHNGVTGIRRRGGMDSNGSVNYKRADAQVEHTFLQPGVREMYQSEQLQLSKLPKWNMPQPYFIKRIKGDKSKNIKDIELYFIDSSIYARAYLDALGKDKNNLNNQAKWLERLVKKNPEAIQYLFLHHPRHVLDKRTLKKHSDLHLYLTEDEIKQFKTLGFEGHSYNELLLFVMGKQGLIFDAEFCAHTHALSYLKGESGCELVLTLDEHLRKLNITSNAGYVFTGHKLFYVNKANHVNVEIPLSKELRQAFFAQLQPLPTARILSAEELQKITRLTQHVHKETCQIISGGGGGDLQQRYNPSADVGCYMHNNGFLTACVDPAQPQHELTLDFHTIKPAQHLRFTSLSREALLSEEKESPEVVALRQIVKLAYQDYMTEIRKIKDFGTSWSSSGVVGLRRADDLHNFFNQLGKIEKMAAYHFIKENLSKSNVNKKNSLAYFVNFHMVKNSGVTWENFIIKNSQEFSQAVQPSDREFEPSFVVPQSAPQNIPSQSSRSSKKRYSPSFSFCPVSKNGSSLASPVGSPLSEPDVVKSFSRSTSSIK